jgi:hypothetical protein
MNHDEFERLAESAIESGDSRERERLETAISANPELREMWADLVATRGALAGAELESLPAGLHEGVLRSIAHESAARREGESWVETLIAALRARPALALGGAVAAGMLIGVIGYGALSGGFAASRALGPSTSATMSVLPSDASELVLELDGTRLEVKAWSREQGRGVTMVTHGTGTATLEWDQAELQLYLPTAATDRASALETAPGSVRLRFDGAVAWDLLFTTVRAEDASIRVKLRGAHGEKHATLSLPR